LEERAARTNLSAAAEINGAPEQDLAEEEEEEEERSALVGRN